MADVPVPADKNTTARGRDDKDQAPLTDCVAYAIPIKVWAQQTDGDLLEMPAEVAEGHPELSVVPGFHLDLSLGGLIHPLPVDITETGWKLAYQSLP